jgi:flavin-dependent dehydrogenase
VHLKDVKRPEGEEGTLITFDVLTTDIWFWVIPFSNGNTSLGFVAPPEYLDSFSGTPEEVFKQLINTSSEFRDRFSGLDFLFEPKKIVGYASAVKQLYGPGYALTGNSAEFLDPVFSSGVSFATESGILASKLAVREIKGEKINWETDYSDYIKEGVNVFKTYVEEWYTGNLQKLFFTRPENPEVKSQICAVLAGYVWDKENPFVKKHDRAVKALAYLIDLENEKKIKASQQ